MSDRQGRRQTETIDQTIAEKSVIGFVLKYPSRIYQCQSIRPQHFSDGQLGEVWRIVTSEIERKGVGITPSLIAEIMVRSGVANQAAAAMLLVECQDHVRNAPEPESAGVTFTSQLIDYGFRRAIERAAFDMTAIAKEAVDTDEIRGNLQSAVYDVLNYETLGQQKSLSQQIHEAISGMDKEVSVEGVGPSGLMTDIDGLNLLLNGFKPGQLVTLMARPSIGKTALGIQLMLHFASTGKRGVFWSLEMNAMEVVGRMACMMTGLDSYNIERKKFAGNERAEYIQALRTIDEWVGDKDRHIHIADAHRLDGRIFPKSITDIAAEAMHWRNRMKIDFLMVDYLQLIAGVRRKGENREREVASVSTTLKQMAQQFQVPVFAMCQARRPDKDHEKRRPRLHEARESGQIEQDSDIVMIIHNYDYVANDDQKPMTRNKREACEINLAKQRNGRTGIVKTDFLTTCGRFEMSSRTSLDSSSTFQSESAPWDSGS